jgi:hypothetical protein
MALNKNHQTHIDTMKAFEVADRNTPRDAIGRAAYGMGAGGMPRTPAQQESVKKAAQASALARKGRAVGAVAAPTLGQGPKIIKDKPGISTGSIGIANPKKGLLSL